MSTKKPFIVKHSGEWAEDFESPKITVINFSGGKQSTAILWMYLLGDLHLEGEVIVLNADPGMENSKTYEIAAKMKAECLRRGVYFETVKGPNLYRDLINLKNTGATRIDLPGYYTKSKAGKKGKLLQKCTQYYKIAPMDRAVRKYIKAKGFKLQEAIVHKIIGFNAKEIHRVKPPKQRYTAFRYPLIELGFTDSEVEQYLTDRNLSVPPRSVCNACFANSPAYMAHLKREHPSGYAQAVSVDVCIRDLTQVGVRDEVYVLSSLKPVEEAVSEIENGDSLEVDEDAACTSGYCFV